MPHVTFVHGIANKIAADDLHHEWLDALRDGDGVDLRAEGVTSSMCYWADVLYAAPAVQRLGAADEAVVDEAVIDELGIADTGDWLSTLPAEEAASVRRLATELGADTAVDPAPQPLAAQAAALERIPLPAPVKRRLMAMILRDVHHYLWDTETTPRPGETFHVRTEVRRRAVEALARAGSSRPHVLVGHSLGTVIAYDVLQNVDEVARVDGLLTLGSPLGLDEVQDRLKPGWSRSDGFPSRSMSTRTWVNVYDRLDPVCGFDPAIASDFCWQGRPTVLDLHEPNWGAWRHDVTKYLRGDQLRQTLAGLLELR